MNCVFANIADGLYQCEFCLRRVRSPSPKIVALCKGTVRRGPGDELHDVLLECGITEFAGCKCREKMAAMNRWGSAGCREHRETILAWLREAAAERGWGEKLRAGAAMASMGINPLAPYDSLLDEALRRAELTQPAAPAV